MRFGGLFVYPSTLWIYPFNLIPRSFGYVLIISLSPLDVPLLYISNLSSLFVFTSCYRIYQIYAINISYFCFKRIGV